MRYDDQARLTALLEKGRPLVCANMGPAEALTTTVLREEGQGCHQCVLGVGLAKALTNSVLR